MFTAILVILGEADDPTSQREAWFNELRYNHRKLNAIHTFNVISKMYLILG